MEDPKKIAKKIRRNMPGEEGIEILLFLRKKGLINFKGEKIPLEVNLTDKGIEFIVNELERKRQNEFNKMVAFAGAILALIGIYTFINDLNLINESNFWLKYLFLILVICAIGPIVAFIIKSYFSKEM